MNSYPLSIGVVGNCPASGLAACMGVMTLGTTVRALHIGASSQIEIEEIISKSELVFVLLTRRYRKYCLWLITLCQRVANVLF